MKYSSKSKNFLQRVGYGIFSDMFCENDFSISKENPNRKFKEATMRNAMRMYGFRKAYKEHDIIDN